MTLFLAGVADHHHYLLENLLVVGFLQVGWEGDELDGRKLGGRGTHPVWALVPD